MKVIVTASAYSVTWGGNSKGLELGFEETVKIQSFEDKMKVKHLVLVVKEVH